MGRNEGWAITGTGMKAGLTRCFFDDTITGPEREVRLYWQPSHEALLFLSLPELTYLLAAANGLIHNAQPTDRAWKLHQTLAYIIYCHAPTSCGLGSEGR